MQRTIRTRQRGRAPIMVLYALGCAWCARTSQAQDRPTARVSATTDTVFGTIVPDPFRWLEDMRSAQTQDWVKGQDAYARGMVGRLAMRQQIRDEVAGVAAANAFGLPIEEGTRLFFTRFPATGPTLDLTILVREAPSAEARVLVDPDTATRAGRRDVRRFAPSPDGRLIAYALAEPGSEWEVVRVRDVATGHDLADSVTGLYRYSFLTWARDARSGFYYTRFPKPQGPQDPTAAVDGGGIFFHQLGTPQDRDVAIYSRPDHADWVLTPRVTDDGRYLVITARAGVSRVSRIYYQDLRAADAKVLPMMETGDALYTFVGNDGPVFWINTDLAAPRSRIIAVDTRDVRRDRWHTLVPEASDAIDAWVGASAIGGRLLVAYRHDARLTARVFDRAGALRYDLRLPSVGSIWTGFIGKTTGRHAYYVLQTVTDPGTLYQLDIATGESSVVLRPSLSYDPTKYVTRQVFFTSRDGTRVPMFIVHRSDVHPRADTPAWIYGYGTQSWTASPWFQPAIVAWLREGNVWALPNLRGGGEYGESWHRGGSRRFKQRGIDDYLAAANWLVAHRYTSPDRLIAHASSTGGILVAAAMIERPKAFAVGILEYPVLDMLRYERFSAGRRWVDEYGTMAERGDAQAMLAYAPIQNARDHTCYPAMFVAPGELDETAAPMHAYKFVATLQRVQSCSEHPVLLRESWGAGHSSGATVEDSIDNWTDQLTFVESILRTSERPEASHKIRTKKA